MKPWQKIPTSVILASMRQRLADDRAATEFEALGEMHVLEETGQLAPMSFLALANHFRWTRHRLRAVLAAWGKVAATMPEQHGAIPTMALPTAQPDNFPTTDRQRSDNDSTKPRQRRATFKAHFSVSTDNTPTTSRQPSDNSPTPSCARGSSGDVDRDLVEIQSTTSPSPECLSATPTHTLSLSDPAPSADPEDDADLCPAELIPAPARSTLPPLVLLPPGPVVVAQSEGEPEDLLALLNALRTELHPRILRADARALSLTPKRRKALTQGWAALAAVARPDAERRALLRAGVLYVYLSQAWPAQGARNTGEPVDTLLRPSHFTDYCERGRQESADLEATYTTLLSHPAGWSPDPFDPARFRRRA